MWRFLTFLIGGVVACFTSCTQKADIPIDSEKTLEMLMNIPNPISTPERVKIFSTGRLGEKEKLYEGFYHEKESSTLLFDSTDHAKIESLVGALRSSAEEMVLNPSDIGVTYHLFFYHTEWILHYIFFAPNSTNDSPFIKPNSAASLYFSAQSVSDWVRTNGIMKQSH